MGFPSCRYGPGGVSQVFDREEDVPAGWEDHPCKVREPVNKLAEAVEVVAQAAADISKFDHDGDGRPGGSKPRRKKAVKNGPAQ